jgi:aconitate hydratase
MNSLSDPFKTLKVLKDPVSGQSLGHYYSLPDLELQGMGKISRLPVSIRIVLESVLRNVGHPAVTQAHVKELIHWDSTQPSDNEIPFIVSRVILQDFTGVPLVVDLAAMRDAMANLSKPAERIEPLVPVDLVIDHSVQVDRYGTPLAFVENLAIEFDRNRERYAFLKWGQEAFKTFNVVPPGVGIVHQVNLEYLASVVFQKKTGEATLLYPDTLVGTDSHTTMVNGLGVVGWGVGGIEAEAAMLGQPVYFQTPAVVGVHLSGKLRTGVTATDLTLRITELLRAQKVVGKFVEFFGEGAQALTVADRATIGNMAPEYGATIGFFPIDEKTLEYLASTGRTSEQIALVRAYYEAQGLFGMPKKDEIDYSQIVNLDLNDVVPCVAGPKRPQDRIDLPQLPITLARLLALAEDEGGYGKVGPDLKASVSVPEFGTLSHASVVIAAITSCTNTSNPAVMIAAGMIAKKAIAKGLTVPKYVKTSLAPGSRVVTDYLEKTGLQASLDKLGFQLVGYGCTTCIGNSGPLDEPIEKAIKDGDLIVASVLSGNRNFEARIHSSVKANFLMSPPLVVAFALAGRVDIDLTTQPLGQDQKGEPVFLKDLWPSEKEIEEALRFGLSVDDFRKRYSEVYTANLQWNQVPVRGGARYIWDSESTYIQRPPFLDGVTMEEKTFRPLGRMRALAVFGDSVTTDHISPAGSIPADGPAGEYLLAHGVKKSEFNSFGSRRGNDQVMTRGTFANVRIRNLLTGGKLGGWTPLMPEGTLYSIYEAAQIYRERQVPLIVFAGQDYGMGSSRDWAAKGTALLGVKAVVATSFERIHRSNLVGMGVLPFQFLEGLTPITLGLDGNELFEFEDLEHKLQLGAQITLLIHRDKEPTVRVPVILRLDTPIELSYYLAGGILPYVLRSIVRSNG